MGKTKRSYSPKLKFQVVLEALAGERTPGQIAKAYGVHPITVGLWKKAVRRQTNWDNSLPQTNGHIL